jgi:uncharacterized membrane-anchored protein YitT (DUF2179 family)
MKRVTLPTPVEWRAIERRFKWLILVVSLLHLMPCILTLRSFLWFFGNLTEQDRKENLLFYAPVFGAFFLLFVYSASIALRGMEYSRDKTELRVHVGINLR